MASPRLPASGRPIPPEAREPLLRFARLAVRPLERFLQIEAASGILLLIATAVALAWANSPWTSSYTALWETPLRLGVGSLTFERSLEWWVNDVLMAVFFFTIGLEIRRELHHGELSEPRRAALPVAAALGGMLVPAAIYLALAGGPETRSGWGVPMATDIAFAVGVLALLGRRVPPALRVLLLALAVIDDLGAILVIAIFYAEGVAWSGLGIAAAAVAAIFVLQWIGVRSKLAYAAPAVVAWAGIYAAGVHPTIAGVIVGLVTPVRAWFGPETLVAEVGADLDRLSRLPPGAEVPSSVLRQIDFARREAQSPAESLIDTLHPWVAYGIMPLFALANAGVPLAGLSLDHASTLVVAGVTAGLAIGKPIGVLLACFLALKLGIGRLPEGLGFRHLLVLGVVAGIGFTMSIFIAGLAFPEWRLLVAAKLGVLVASTVAGVAGLVLGRLLLRPAAAGVAGSADEAEGST